MWSGSDTFRRGSDTRWECDFPRLSPYLTLSALFLSLCPGNAKPTSPTELGMPTPGYGSLFSPISGCRAQPVSVIPRQESKQQNATKGKPSSDHKNHQANTQTQKTNR